jgi:membrane fusion protein (multidrug efflux system)
MANGSRPSTIARLNPADAPPAIYERPAPVTEQRVSRYARRLLVRLILAVVGPAALVAFGLHAYLAGGRFVSTSDAYVKADKIQVSADIAGRVMSVPVNENQVVKEGDILFKIDDEPFRIAATAAKARLLSVRNDVEALKASYRQKLSELKKAQDTVAYYQRTVERNRGLTAKGFVSVQIFDDAQHNLEAAQQTVSTDRQDIARDVAALGGDPDLPVEQQAAVLQAQAMLDKANLDLRYTEVRAPANGIVTNVTLRKGDYVRAGDATFVLVPSDRLWVEANFKETQLTHIRDGQPAKITVDTYPGCAWVAVAESIAPASGAEFALLPPQNATGNWVKVVQRIPVRLKVQDGGCASILRAGMSVEAEVDTGHKRSLDELWSDAKDWIGL